jgi:hypothetical protein
MISVSYEYIRFFSLHCEHNTQPETLLKNTTVIECTVQYYRTWKNTTRKAYVHVTYDPRNKEGYDNDNNNNHNNNVKVQNLLHWCSNVTRITYCK